jgi:hypothetical protein
MTVRFLQSRFVLQNIICTDINTGIIYVIILVYDIYKECPFELKFQ